MSTSLEQEHKIKYRQSLQFGHVHAKNQARPPIYTIHENGLKMDTRLKVTLKTIKILQVNTSSKISDTSYIHLLRRGEKRKK